MASLNDDLVISLANKRFFIAGDRRDLKKEGYYVGHRPQVEDWSLNRVENRLITEKSRGKDEEVDIDSYRVVYLCFFIIPFDNLCLKNTVMQHLFQFQKNHYEN